jgi:hypothetical protein
MDETNCAENNNNNQFVELSLLAMHQNGWDSHVKKCIDETEIEFKMDAINHCRNLILVR